MDGHDTMRELADAADLSLPMGGDLMMDHSSKSARSESHKRPRASKKPPNAPKRFKSSFIFFSMAKHKEIKEQLSVQGESAKTTNITKVVSDAWRNMGPDERAKYDGMAKQDKERYEREKASYKPPPGSIPSKKQRDPDAPKRPMSAFLAFANTRRAEVKGQNPDCSNGEISKILSKMWKEAPAGVTQKYRADEASLWAAYKVGMVEYRKKTDGRKKAAKVLQTAAAKKKRKKKLKEDHDSISAGSGIDDSRQHSLSASSIFDSNPNQDEMLAASALRGVRGGPNLGYGGMQHQGSLGFDSGLSNQQQLHQNPAVGGYGALFGGSSGVSQYAAPGGAAGGVSLAQDSTNPPNRSLLEMGFNPYQQYGSYPLGNSQQAILMAQALRGGQPSIPNQLLGLSESQPPLSQLASIAGSQNGVSHSPAVGMNVSIGNMMNDNSTGSANRLGMPDGNRLNGLPGTERF